MDTKRAFAAATLLLALTGVTESALGQDQFHLSLDDAIGAPGEQVLVQVVLDSEAVVSGFSFSLCYDDTVANAIAVERGPDLDSGAWFWDTILPGAVTLGAVMGSHAGGTPIDPGVGLRIVDITFQITGDVGDATSIDFCLAGSPPVATAVVVAGVSIEPALTAGSITVAAGFRRADCNGDGNVDLGDPIFIEQYLFLGGELPGCRSACDSNDDGLLNIADSIATLTYLFSGGSPPPAPFMNCGPDLTDDELDCEAAIVCSVD